MSENPNDERIEELRQQKMQELKEQAQEGGGAGGGEGQQAAREQAQAQKQALLKQHLTDGARQRLNAVQMSKPEVAEQVEQQVVALARSGRIQDRIDEDQMRKLLKELTPDKSFDIQRR
jgi:programmed cell death protein 5